MENKKTLALIGVLLVLALLFAGCASESNDTQDTQNSQTTQAQNQPADILGGGDMSSPPDDGGQG